MQVKHAAFALLIATSTLGSCTRSDNASNPSQLYPIEAFTTVKLTVINTADRRDSATAQWEQLIDGRGNPINPLPDTSLNQVFLRPNASYESRVELLDKSKNPTANMTEEVSEKKNDHRIFFVGGPIGVNIVPTDRDANNLPVGLKVSVATGAAGAGRLRVVLKHQPGQKSAAAGIDVGSTDVDASFRLTVR